jgi:hypothetical protein
MGPILSEIIFPALIVAAQSPTGSTKPARFNLELLNACHCNSMCSCAPADRTSTACHHRPGASGKVPVGHMGTTTAQCVRHEAECADLVSCCLLFESTRMFIGYGLCCPGSSNKHHIGSGVLSMGMFCRDTFPSPWSNPHTTADFDGWKPKFPAFLTLCTLAGLHEYPESTLMCCRHSLR